MKKLMKNTRLHRFLEQAEMMQEYARAYIAIDEAIAAISCDACDACDRQTVDLCMAVYSMCDIAREAILGEHADMLTQEYEQGRW